MDRDDPLRAVRSRFELPAGIVYLDGNSLGALPSSVPARMRRVVEDEWGTDLIGAWNGGWIDLPVRAGEKIARLIGAEVGSVVACDSTTINLHKVVSAALALRPDRKLIVTDLGNFPTDRYVLDGLGRVRAVAPDEVAAALDEGVAALVLTEVDFRSGRRHDVAAITAAAHEAGALAVWDLAHSAGVLPVDVSGAGVDFAVGCGYKFLHGGPGAPGFLYVSPAHVDRFDNPLRGWFGHADPFAFSPDFEPAVGIERGMVGTPNVLSLAALDEALDVFSDLDIADLHDKSMELTGLFIDLVDEALGEFEVITPRDPDERGSQVSLRHDAAYEIVQALVSRGVVGDFRTPDVARFGFSPLTVRYADVYDAVMALRQVMDDEAWRDARFGRRRRVT